MDVLIVDRWTRGAAVAVGAPRVRYAPELARDPRGFRAGAVPACALIIPPSVALDAETLQAAPQLRAVGRLSAGAENIDLEACARAGVEVVRPADASAAGRGRVRDRRAAADAAPRAGGQRRGPAGRPRARRRTVGLVGMTPAAQPLAQLLAAFGARVSATTRRCTPATACGRAGASSRWPARADGAQRRRLRAAGLLHALPRPARRALPGRLQAQPGAGEPGALQPVRRQALADALATRPHGRGLVRQHGARHAGPRPAAARRRHAAGHAARGQHHARVAHAQRLGRGPAHRRAAAAAAPHRSATVRPTTARRAR
jgi:hypothetical protein